MNIIDFKRAAIAQASIDQTIWVGLSTDNSNWSSPLNWLKSQLPVDGRNLMFTGQTRLNNANDIAALTIQNITFLPNAGAFNISGNSWTQLSNSSITNNSSNIQTIGNAISSNATTFNCNTADISLGGVISGTNGLIKTGDSALILKGINTVTGITSIYNGALRLDGGAGRLPTSAAVILGDADTTGKLILGGTTAANQTLAGLSTSGLGGSVVGGNSSNSTLTLTIPNGASLTFDGTIGGTGTNENNLSIVKTGIYLGTNLMLRLNGDNTYTGGTSLGAYSGTTIAGHNNAFGTNTITLNGNGPTLALADGITISNNINIGAGGNFKTLALSDGATSGTFSGNINNSEDTHVNFVLFVSTGGTLTFSGIISGVNPAGSGLVKNGPGTAILTGANTYIGPTGIYSGTLEVIKDIATATFTPTQLTVTFSTPPSAGQTYRFFPGATTNTYSGVILQGAPGLSGSYNSTNSTLTIA
jgi:autotransporter-associated beta strand protein